MALTPAAGTTLKVEAWQHSGGGGDGGGGFMETDAAVAAAVASDCRSTLSYIVAEWQLCLAGQANGSAEQLVGGGCGGGGCANDCVPVVARLCRKLLRVAVRTKVGRTVVTAKINRTGLSRYRHSMIDCTRSINASTNSGVATTKTRNKIAILTSTLCVHEEHEKYQVVPKYIQL